MYLDWNATTPLVPEAWEAMQAALRVCGNPSSAHAAGRKSRQLLEDSREKIAALLGAAAEEVVFTSGATEANNLALFGLASDARHIIASPIEHPCGIEPLKQLEARGAAIDWLPVSSKGVVVADAAMKLMRPETRLVSVMLVNHETGAIQPVTEIVGSLPKDVRMHTDAAQAVGKMPVNFHELDVTALTASAHKFGGPAGVGVLLLRKSVSLKPQQFGGHQQQSRRPGTEPVALAAGMAAALDSAMSKMIEHSERLRASRELLWGILSDLATPVVLNGPPIGSPQVLPTTLNVSFPGCRGDVLLMALDLAGIACSTGSACSSGSLLPSPVLRAMGVPDDVLRSAIRFSFSGDTRAADLVEAAKQTAEVVSRVRDS